MPDKSITPRQCRTTHGHSRWLVVWPLSLTGGKQRRSYFETRSAAERHAQKLAAMRDDHRNGFDLLSLPERVQASIAIQKAGGVINLGKAVEFFLLHNPQETRSVAELVAEFIADRKRLRLRERYVKPLRNSLLTFARHFDRREAHELTAAEISDWLMPTTAAGKAERNWSPGTIKTHLKNVRAMFAFALTKKYVAANPAVSIEPPKDNRQRPVILSPEDAERLMRLVERWDPGLIQYVALILFGGLRPEESEACRKEYIGETVIDLPPDVLKNNKRRLVELGDLPTLKAWLAIAPEFSRANLRKRMDAVRDATKSKGDPERIGPIPWGHDILRKSFVSYSAAIHGVAKTGLLADHSEQVLKHHYRELVTRAEAERFWGILPK